MPDPADAAASVLLFFFGTGILVAVYASLYGGDVTAVTNVIAALAGPITIVAILVAVAVATANTVSGR